MLASSVFWKQPLFGYYGDSLDDASCKVYTFDQGATSTDGAAEKYYKVPYQALMLPALKRKPLKRLSACRVLS